MSQSQPNRNQTFSRFADWCLHKDSLSEEARHTVEVLLAEQKLRNITSLFKAALRFELDDCDCYEAEQVISSYTELNLSNQNISDLRPLSTLINLINLNLSYNSSVSDFIPLFALSNLTQLNLRGNGISDLSFLSGLTNLTHLELSCNEISDLSFLSKLTNLTTLYIDGNRISDLSSLCELNNLIELRLNKNQISDLSPLSELNNLIELELNNNQVSDLSPLWGLTNLTQLRLDNNQISDLSSLSGLLNLVALDVIGNNISDLNPLSELINLNSLSAEITISDWSWLPSLQQKWLTLLTQPIDYQKAIETVKYAYKLIGYEEPKFIVCSNPKINIKYLRKQQNLGESLFWEICYSIVKKNQGLWFFLSSQVQNKILQQPSRSIIEELYTINDDIEDETEDEDSDNLEFLEGLYITPDDILNIICTTELLVRELQYQLSPQEQKLLRCLNQLLENCGWIFPFEKVCIVCDRPRKISLDSDNQLHAEAEPAIQFADGWHTGYYYHGVKIPEQYGKLHFSEWQPQWLLAEDNAEVRRVLIQVIGYDRICEELQAQVLDSWQEYTLLCMDADVDVEPIHLLKMTCPSTARIHTLRVPPEILSARIAIRWINWDIDPEEFSVQT